MNSDEKLTEIRHILGLTRLTAHMHARYNLDGVCHDFARDDVVCLRTVQRVMKQLADVEEVLNSD